MRESLRSPVCLLALIALMVLVAGPAIAWEVFSPGMIVPETISEIPNGEGWNGDDYLGLPNIVGDFLVPDPGQPNYGVVWHVPRAGGPSNEFRFEDFLTTGGVFLPWPVELWVGYLQYYDEHHEWVEHYTSVSIPNAFLVTGFQYQEGSTSVPRVEVYHPDTLRIAELYAPTFDVHFDVSVPYGAGGLTTPIIAPAEFGSNSRALMITDQDRGVWAYHTGSLTSPLLFFDSWAYEVSTGAPIDPFGAAFAPAGFGDVGGTLLVSDGDGGDDGKVSILSIAANGAVQKFMDLPLSEEQVAIDAGLRQMAFFPDGFEDLSGLLALSVSGSKQGGGALGQLLAINEAGEVVKILKLGSEVDKFDPRGVLFLDDGRLLISDASDAILVATAADFVVIPEPATILLLAMATASLATVRWWRRRYEHPPR